MEEVAEMEIYTMKRPSLLLAAACAPSVSPLPTVAPVAWAVAERASASRAHQVQIQAELGRTSGSAYAASGTTGFEGSNGTTVKRMTDDANGVPPRGRPV
jgi:hypothetical protein